MRVGTGIILFIGGVIGAAIAGVTLVNDARFWLEGESTVGTVIDKSQARAGRPLPLASVLFAHGGAGNRPGYMVEYEYQDSGGAVRRGSGRVTHSEWVGFNPGNPIEVVYLPSDPSRSRPAGQVGPPAELGAVILACLFGGVVLVASGVGWARRQAELVEHGVPVLAVIDALDEQTGKRGIRSLRARYRYLAGTGEEQAVRRGKTLWLPERKVSGWERGGAILVLVNPDSPGDHAADVFDARPEERQRLLAAGSASA
jgi:hypothetical protein